MHSGQLVLLVEDNSSDARLMESDTRLMEEAFRRSDKAIRVQVAVDGFEAMAYLRREGPHTDAARPDLMVLDLTLPGLSGLDALAEIKKDPQLKPIPLIILSMSDLPVDIAAG